MYKNVIYYMLIVAFITFNSCYASKHVNYFVSTYGDDANNGSINKPFRTIQKAANVVKAGDVVFIKKGIYKERVILTNSGRKNKKIKFRNYRHDRVIIDGNGINWRDEGGGLFEFDNVSYIVLSGIEIRNSTHAGIYLYSSDHITIKNSKTHNTYSSGIGVWSSRNVNVKNNDISLACNDGEEECISVSDSSYVNIMHNEVHDSGPGTNGGEGIDIKEGSKHILIKYNHVYNINGSERPALYADAWDKYTSDIVFESNLVHNIKANAIAVASEMGGLLTHVTFVNNLIYNIQSEGFILGGWTADDQTVDSNPVENISIINNTFYNIGGDGIYIGNKDATNIKIYNNIIKSKHEQLPIYIDYTPIDEVDIRNNLVDINYENYEQKNEIVANPLFVNARNKNFHLKARSPAINKGRRNKFSTLDYDRYNRKRDGKWDIGAFEYKK